MAGKRFEIDAVVLSSSFAVKEVQLMCSVANAPHGSDIVGRLKEAYLISAVTRDSVIEPTVKPPYMCESSFLNSTLCLFCKSCVWQLSNFVWCVRAL